MLLTLGLFLGRFFGGVGVRQGSVEGTTLYVLDHAFVMNSSGERDARRSLASSGGLHGLLAATAP